MNVVDYEKAIAVCRCVGATSRKRHRLTKLTPLRRNRRIAAENERRESSSDKRGGDSKHLRLLPADYAAEAKRLAGAHDNRLGRTMKNIRLLVWNR